MSPRISSAIFALGHDVEHVVDEGLSGQDDHTIWSAAQAEERFLITQDREFGDERLHPPGSHCGVLLLRYGQVGLHEMRIRVRTLFISENVAAWWGRIVVAKRKKVRVRDR